LIKTRLFPRIRHIVLFFLSFSLFVGGAAAHGTKDKELISPADLASAGGTYLVLDIRSQDEFAKGHVPGAFSLPLAELSQSRLKGLGIKPDNQVVLSGVSESSARKAKMLLDILGYSNLRILAGGYTHWIEDGQDIESGSPPPASGAAETVSAPPLKVLPEIHDFGVIQKKNGIVSTIFEVQNISTENVTITEITTSCGCTTAEIEAKLIPPGEDRTLRVYFDPDFHKEPEGKFSRTVFLQTSNNFEIQAKLEVEIAQ